MVDSSEIKPHILLLDFFPEKFYVYKTEWTDDIYRMSEKSTYYSGVSIIEKSISLTAQLLTFFDSSKNIHSFLNDQLFYLTLWN